MKLTRKSSFWIFSVLLIHLQTKTMPYGPFHTQYALHKSKMDILLHPIRFNSVDLLLLAPLDVFSCTVSLGCSFVVFSTSGLALDGSPGFRRGSQFLNPKTPRPHPRRREGPIIFCSVRPTRKHGVLSRCSS